MTERCIEVLRQEGFDGKTQLPTDECFQMMPPQRWVGLWRNDFEGSQFCASPASSCGFHSQRERVWLDWPNRPESYGGLYKVEFIGRRTRHASQHGHMGAFHHAMIVDRAISLKQLEPPRPEPTKAEVVNYWKACEAKQMCSPDWDYINRMED